MEGCNGASGVVGEAGLIPEFLAGIMFGVEGGSLPRGEADATLLYPGEGEVDI